MAKVSGQANIILRKENNMKESETNRGTVEVGPEIKRVITLCFPQCVTMKCNPDSIVFEVPVDEAVKVAWRILHTAGCDTSVSPYGGQIRRINYRGINKACRSHRDDFGILIADDANQKTL
jgi:hypothetical protein